MDRSDHPMPRWVAAVLVGVLLMAGASVAVWSVELPYVAFSPGPVADALDAIELVEDIDRFDPAGELLMLTISNQDLNAFEVLAAAMDPTIDVIPREFIRPPDETDQQYQERILEQMDISEQTAVLVALEKLGMTIVTDGVEILGVVPEYPAAEILQPGDLIREVEGISIHLTNDIGEVISDLAPGDEVDVVIERGGVLETVTVVLGESDQEAGTPIVGVRVQNLNPRFPVTIESGNVGGPSAGLMYTLAVIDLLSEGDLARGHVIAGTGTIRPDGTVGAIGGIRQKVVAAEAAGASAILVPEGNYDDALTAPRTDIDIVSVSTVDEALGYLEGLPPV